MTGNGKVYAERACRIRKRRWILGGGGSFRSGVQPPTGTVADRQRRAGLFDEQQRKAQSESLSKYLAGVDRSGRGFNPRPAQDRLRPAQNDRGLSPAAGGGEFGLAGDFAFHFGAGREAGDAHAGAS